MDNARQRGDTRLVPVTETPYAQRPTPAYTTGGMHPLLANQPRYCLACGEPLKLPDSLGEAPRCEHCLKPFDPKDPASFAVDPPSEPVRWWQTEAAPGLAWLVLYPLGCAVIGKLMPTWVYGIGGGSGGTASAFAGVTVAVGLFVFGFLPWHFSCVYLLLVAFEKHLRDEVMWYLIAGALLGAVIAAGYHPALMLVGLLLGLLAGLVRQAWMNAG